MIALSVVRDILLKTKYSTEALKMINDMEKKTDLIDVDQAKVVADRLNETNPLERLPSKGTISNWVCQGRLVKYGTNYQGPRRGRPKVLISKSEFVELLLNQPPIGRSVGWRKEKVLVA